MVLRLILVGLVAGLGSNMPTRRDLDTMARSAQNWMIARLADWDDQSASDLRTTVYVLEPAPTATAPAPAAPAPNTDAQFADALDETVASFAQDELAGKAREADQIVMNRDEVTVAETSKSLAIDLPTEPASVASDEPVITDVAFSAMIEETVQTFTADLAALEETRERDLAFNIEETVQTFTADLAALEETRERDLAFNNVVDEIVDTFDQDASSLAKVDPTPNPEPLEVEEDSYTGEAYALNRLSDGIQEPTPAAESTSRTENQLTNAVRLTREAVIAWASLLHGPAIVSTSP